MDINKLDKVTIVIGYKNLNDYLLKLCFPIIGAVLFLLIILPFVLPNLGIVFSLVIFILMIIGLIAYPAIKYSNVNQEINENLHYFITYAGTIATMKISRHMLFQRIAQKRVFGEISNIFEKILYLAKDWNFGFANSCRTMNKRIPSAILADFLDRFAVIMDFGEELDVFLDDEQEAVLDDYKVEYEKSIEVIKMIQELFMALSVSFAFLISTIMLAPLLVEAPVENLLLYSLIGLVLMDASIIVSIRSFIPGDSILHSLPDKNLMQKKIKRSFLVLLIFSALLFIALTYLTDLPFVLDVAISITPLLYPGFLARTEEELIKKRDIQFPVFVRVFGSAIEVRNGGVISALRATQIHEFGNLDAMNINLHRRLRLGSDKYKSWYYYAVESGSNIISNFSKIFSESVYIGGNAEKIGEIVSSNIQHLLSLRKLRRQVAESSTGIFYGITIGVSMTVFITYRIAEKMFELFSIGDSADDTMVEFASAIMPMGQDINFSVILVYITVMLVVHSFTSSWIIKIIDGGSNYTLLINLIFMTWIIVALYLTMPAIVDSVLPDMGNIWAGT